MSNFVTEFKKAIQGENKGIPFGPGLEALTRALNGIQKARVYGVAAAPKVGKSTVVDYAFVLQVYLWYLIEKQNDPELELEFIYFSFEIDRVSKEMEFAVFFLYQLYQIETVTLPEGITKDGKNEIPLNANYLRGRIMDDNGENIRPNPTSDLSMKLKAVYEQYIIPLFGEFAENGTMITQGLIRFIEHKENPTGLYKSMKRHAEKYGSWVKEGQGNFERIVGYTPRNSKKWTIVITDHLRKLPTERGWNLKQTVDKYLEYSIELKNWCQWTFVHIIHLNRSMADVQRMKQYGDLLYPTSDDIKDTGNMAEDADYVLTMFNPNDDRYNLKKHFGMDLKDTAGNTLYPLLRTLHLVESRHCEYPQHFRLQMQGNTKSFKQFNP